MLVLKFGGTTRTLTLSDGGDCLQGGSGATFDATGAAHTINIAGDGLTISSDAITLSSTSTMNYNGTGSPQRLISGLTAYGNLTFSGSGGTKQIRDDDLDLAGNFTISGSPTVTFLNGTINSMTIGGNYNVYGDAAFNHLTNSRKFRNQFIIIYVADHTISYGIKAFNQIKIINFMKFIK